LFLTVVVPSSRLPSLPVQIKTKSVNECVDFYYVWKKSSHYAMWKEHGKPTRKVSSNREQQWRILQEKMKKLSSRSHK
jgi:hypothetical protein